MIAWPEDPIIQHSALVGKMSPVSADRLGRTSAARPTEGGGD